MISGGCLDMGRRGGIRPGSGGYDLQGGGINEAERVLVLPLKRVDKERCIRRDCRDTHLRIM